MEGIYRIELIPSDLSTEETVYQIADTLDNLNDIVNDVFARILTRIDANAKQTSGLQERITASSERVKKLKGATTAVKVFSTPKYPAAHVQRAYRSVLAPGSPGRAGAAPPPRVRGAPAPRPPRTDKDLQEKLHFYHVKVGEPSGAAERRSLASALERLDGGGVGQLLTFESGASPYPGAPLARAPRRRRVFLHARHGHGAGAGDAAGLAAPARHRRRRAVRARRRCRHRALRARLARLPAAAAPTPRAPRRRPAARPRRGGGRRRASCGSPAAAPAPTAAPTAAAAAARRPARAASNYCPRCGAAWAGRSAARSAAAGAARRRALEPHGCHPAGGRRRQGAPARRLQPHTRPQVERWRWRGLDGGPARQAVDAPQGDLGRGCGGSARRQPRRAALAVRRHRRAERRRRLRRRLRLRLGPRPRLGVTSRDNLPYHLYLHWLLYFALQPSFSVLLKKLCVLLYGCNAFKQFQLNQTTNRWWRRGGEEVFYIQINHVLYRHNKQNHTL